MASKAHATSLLLTLNLLLFITLGSCARTPPPPPPPPSSSQQAHCPIDVRELGVCADLLNPVNATIGSPPATPCCSLLDGLVDLDAAVCLCGAIEANVLGIDVEISGSMDVILNECGKNASGFQCKNN